MTCNCVIPNNSEVTARSDESGERLFSRVCKFLEELRFSRPREFTAIRVFRDLLIFFQFAFQALMIKFASRVQVWSSGHYLFRTHGEHAASLVGTARAIVDVKGKRVWRISLINTTAAVPSAPPHKLRLRDYAGAPMIFLEDLGTMKQQRLRTYTFKPQIKDDQARMREERSYVR